MFPYNEINDDLLNDAIAAKLFDFYRLVDISTHSVCEYGKGATEVRATDETCHHVWGRFRPCANCTSSACILRQEEIIKIEQLNEQVLLIFSVPTEVNGHPYALELIKDVSNSLMVPSAVKRDNIEITQMISQFNELATHDSFTGLFNKTYSMNQLQIAIDDCATENDIAAGTNPAIVMLDVDRFKGFNDLYGHIAGDEVLAYFASEFKRIVGDYEDAWAARFGGDEFALGFPHGLDSIEREALFSELDRIQAHAFKVEDGTIRLGLSYGIAYAEPGDTPKALLDRADKEMYLMKETHRRF